MEEEIKETVKKVSLLRRLWNWWNNLFKEEYELTVWFHAETTVSGDGLKTITRSKRTFTLSALTKTSPTHMVGKDANGHAFEIKTVEPFDYTITKTK
jgi:hypothetical protein